MCTCFLFVSRVFYLLVFFAQYELFFFVVFPLVEVSTAPEPEMAVRRIEMAALDRGAKVKKKRENVQPKRGRAR